MVDYDFACKKAYDFFEENCGYKGLVSAYETQDYWVFHSGIPNVKMIGRPSIAVDKKNGELLYLSMTDKNQAKILLSAKKIDFPDKFSAN